MVTDFNACTFLQHNYEKTSPNLAFVMQHNRNLKYVSTVLQV